MFRLISGKLRAVGRRTTLCGTFLSVFVIVHALGPIASANSVDANLSETVLFPGHIVSFPLHAHVGTGSAAGGTDSFCGTDFSSESARFAARSYYEARVAGLLLRTAKTLMVPDIGDERPFNVNEAGWEERTFRLVDKTSEYYLWMDVDAIAQLPGFDTAAFRNEMMDSTPFGSIDPSSGVLVNNNNIFGLPPDFDQDGITDILLYDIGGPDSIVAGYVSSADVFPGAAEGVGNQADVLYVDPFRNVTDIAAVTAHEYVHLIHLRWGWDEETFLTEGYAEYGMVLNGYSFWRTIDYLRRDFDLPTDEGTTIVQEYELPFFTWRPGGGPAARDYQRGNHFFTYTAEQYDAQLVGEMLRNKDKGATGMQQIIQARGGDLGDHIVNFHAANLINDGSVDPRFKHLESGRSNLGTRITKTINGEVRLLNDEDELVYESIEPGREIQGGAVVYVKWSDVADFSLSFDAVGFEGICADPELETLCESVKSTLRRPLKAVIIGIRPDFSEQIWEITPDDEPAFFRGTFTFLTAVLSHTDPGVFSSAPGALNTIPVIAYEATWTPLSLITDTEESLPLPQAFALNQNYPNPFNPRTTIPFQMDRTGPAKLSIYDMLGRRVAVLVDEVLPAGSYERQFDASAWPSGTYVMHLERGGEQLTRLMQLVK